MGFIYCFLRDAFVRECFIHSATQITARCLSNENDQDSGSNNNHTNNILHTCNNTYINNNLDTSNNTHINNNLDTSNNTCINNIKISSEIILHA